jgi:hypothetical protein
MYTNKTNKFDNSFGFSRSIQRKTGKGIFLEDNRSETTQMRKFQEVANGRNRNERNDEAVVQGMFKKLYPVFKVVSGGKFKNVYTGLKHSFGQSGRSKKISAELANIAVKNPEKTIGLQGHSEGGMSLVRSTEPSVLGDAVFKEKFGNPLLHRSLIPEFDRDEDELEFIKKQQESDDLGKSFLNNISLRTYGSPSPFGRTSGVQDQKHITTKGDPITLLDRILFGQYGGDRYNEVIPGKGHGYDENYEERVIQDATTELKNKDELWQAGGMFTSDKEVEKRIEKMNKTQKNDYEK